MTQQTYPELPTYGVDVQSLGACGDGSTDDGPAIQEALDSGRELVTVPYGVYRIGRTLRVGSNTRLVVHPRARLLLADGAGADQDSFLLANAQPKRGDARIRVEGGIWDGNNAHNPRGPDSPGSYTGVLISFTNVSGLTLRSLTLRDPESYYVRLCELTDFAVEQIRFEAPHLRPNQDGIHLGGYCEDGVIRNLVGVGPGTTNDDLVALNADDANQRAQNLGKRCGPIRRVRIEDLSADSCHTFVRLLSITSPIEDVTIEGVRGGCRVSALNMDGCRGCRVPLFDPDDPQFADGVGQVARIALRDLHVHKSTGAHVSPLLDLRTNVSDFVVEGLRRNRDRDASPKSPTLHIGDMRPCRVVLEGLNHAQLQALRAVSVLHWETVERLAAVRDDGWYRGCFEVERDGALLVGDGGFGGLTVNSP